MVDDDADFRAAVCEALRDERFVVDEACDGRSALERCGPYDYDLYLLDECMPIMNGHQLAAMVRTAGSRGAILFVTAAPWRVHEVQKRLPDAHLLRKPVDLDELISVVQRALWWRRLREQRARPEPAGGAGPGDPPGAG